MLARTRRCRSCSSSLDRSESDHVLEDQAVRAQIIATDAIDVLVLAILPGVRRKGVDGCATGGTDEVVRSLACLQIGLQYLDARTFRVGQPFLEDDHHGLELVRLIGALGTNSLPGRGFGATNQQSARFGRLNP